VLQFAQWGTMCRFEQGRASGLLISQQPRCRQISSI
jgi:hypothetical protein